MRFLYTMGYYCNAKNNESESWKMDAICDEETIKGETYHHPMMNVIITDFKHELIKTYKEKLCLNH